MMFHGGSPSRKDKYFGTPMHLKMQVNYIPGAGASRIQAHQVECGNRFEPGAY
jgi:hypothetical protein